MDEFLKTLRQTISETAEAVGKKTEDLVEIQKLRVRIRTAQRDAELEYKKLGHLIFERFVEGEAMDVQLTEVCEQILKIQEKITDCQDQLAKKKGQSVCPSCGKGNPAGASFCMFCGTVMPSGEEDSAAEEETGVPAQEEERTEEQGTDGQADETKDCGACADGEEENQEESK